jgi:hypothetical protein
VISCLALFVALSGTAVALQAGSVGPREIAQDAVRSKHVKDRAIKSQDLRFGAVTAAELASDSIQPNHIQNGAVTTDKAGQGFLTQAGGNRALRYYAYEMPTGGDSQSFDFGRVRIETVATNQIKVCTHFFGTWGYGISIDGGALVQGTGPSGGCGPTHNLTTGGTFQINTGQDMIWGSGDASTAGYYFVYGLYSP